MPVLLIVHHTASPALHSLFDAVMTGAREGAAADPTTPVDVVARPALTCTAVDVLEADAYILGTPANLGYMSGALPGARHDGVEQGVERGRRRVVDDQEDGHGAILTPR